MTTSGETLLLTGARVFGGSGWNPPDWSEAVAIQGGLIAAVGTSADLKSRFPSGREIDLGGALLLPGLCDAHIHLATGGRSLTTVDLVGLDRDGIAEKLSRTSIRSGSPGWLEACNWEAWRAPLDAAFLDAIFPNFPVVVYGRDLHSVCCNSAALATTGITSETAVSEGGVIEHDDDGVPTGILRDEAMNLIIRFIPQPERAAVTEHILSAQEHLLRLGVTAVSEILDSGAEGIYRELDADGRLQLMVDAWRRLDNGGIDSPPPQPGRRFQVNTVKAFLDGSFGSRTAALDAPFSDDPGNTGLLIYSDGEIFSQLSRVVGLGWRVALHAIGDRAFAQACRVLAQLPRVPAGPHRIEHLQLLPINGVKLMQQCFAVASVQPVHFLDDTPWLATHIGAERCRRTFIWRSLLETGVPLAIGSDWPVASADPRLNLHAAINRCGFKGGKFDEYDPAEALPPHLAVRAATHGWAVAAGLAHRRGAITPGLTADLTIITDLPAGLRDWSRAQIRFTICAGEIAFR